MNHGIYVLLFAMGLLPGMLILLEMGNVKDLVSST